MCFSNERWQAPSIRATLDPLVGAKDAYAVIANKPRQGNTDPLNLSPKKSDPPKPIPIPQSEQAPNSTPLKRRNANGGIAMPTGGTLLSGPGGVPASQLTLGGQTLLGGG